VPFATVRIALRVALLAPKAFLRLPTGLCRLPVRGAFRRVEMGAVQLASKSLRHPMRFHRSAIAVLMAIRRVRVGAAQPQVNRTAAEAIRGSASPSRLRRRGTTANGWVLARALGAARRQVRSFRVVAGPKLRDTAVVRTGTAPVLAS
jgi:hypothetical protein